MARATISARIDSNDKAQFDRFCEAVGLTTSELLNIFVKEVIREQRIPFTRRKRPLSRHWKPEPPEGGLSGFWRRRIGDENRLVYQVKDGQLEILSCKGHYE